MQRSGADMARYILCWWNNPPHPSYATAMSLTRAALDPSMIFLASAALIVALLTVRAVVAPHRIDRPPSQDAIELFGSAAAALLVSSLLTGEFVSLLPILDVFLATAAVMRYFANRLSMPGVLWVTVQPLALLTSALWACLFIAESHLPGWLQASGMIAILLSVATFGVAFVERFVREAVLTHELWRQPIAALAPTRASQELAVSVHLPCYAEPPEVVMATIDRLARQSYSRFEVLVCDNNTPDEAMWRPLERHCALWNKRLGAERFRFFHVAPLAGAKAGALNYCLEVMAPETEIVAVIDADYYSRPDFLSRLVGFFRDERIGYVQTPHDYRDHAQSPYLDACYWEYMPNNKVEMPGVNEYGGAFTIGTMCLLRASVLKRIGGWAEWCLTEDSEVSVRLRAAGYEGIYLGETYGRGLIPETFEDYKKQRFRWTAGPVQQLRRHWRLFLPAPFAPPMPGLTKVLEILRCIAPLKMLTGLVATLIGIATTATALATGAMAPIDVPNICWLLLALGAATGLARTWHGYRLAGCRTASQMIMGEVARQSLFYTILVGGIAGLSSRPLAWRRTPKFAPAATSASPFRSTKPETLLGSLFLLAGGAMLAAHETLGPEFAIMAFAALAAYAARFWCAPYMAMLSIRHVNATEDGDSGPAIDWRAVPDTA
jgi:cellulose synthase/poly-beta-1,6-N-acetylglucosamine synthase-like glycosyltransferase